MKNVIITGSTGMIGGEVLQECLQNKSIKKITSIKEHFKNQDLCIYCLAVYQNQVLKKEYKKITVDYLRAFATLFKKMNTNATFCLFSAAGADLKEKSFMQFARDKGAAENVIINCNFKHAHIFRPGYIYPTKPRKEPNILYSITRKLYKPIFSKIFPNSSITSRELAKAMVITGLTTSGKIIYENKDIKKICK